MNIKDKITEWQESFKDEFCCSDIERLESNQELELVLHAIDTLTKHQPKHNERDALRIRSQATNCMLCDSEFLKMLNKDIKP